MRDFHENIKRLRDLTVKFETEQARLIEDLDIENSALKEIC